MSGKEAEDSNRHEGQSDLAMVVNKSLRHELGICGNKLLALAEGGKDNERRLLRRMFDRGFES
jgi:hypothetical protein